MTLPSPPPSPPSPPTPPDYRGLMLFYAREAVSLIEAGAFHADAFHESAAMRSDSTLSLRACPGCRLIEVARRLHELAARIDDILPRDRFVAGKRERISNRDLAYEEVLERFQVEESAG